MRCRVFVIICIDVIGYPSIDSIARPRYFNRSAGKDLNRACSGALAFLEGDGGKVKLFGLVVLSGFILLVHFHIRSLPLYALDAFILFVYSFHYAVQCTGYFSLENNTVDTLAGYISSHEISVIFVESILLSIANTNPVKGILEYCSRLLFVI